MKTQSPLLLESPRPLQLNLPAFERLGLMLVGCGGTGSHLASGLSAIAQVLAERNVTVDLLFVDPDRVEPKNVGRQLFSQGDIGRPKAEVLAERLNAAFGMRVGGLVRAIDRHDNLLMRDCDLNLVIGAVDNPGARALIRRAVHQAGPRLWWLDCGNERQSGQVALGNCTDPVQLRQSVSLGLISRLPAPSVLYPDLVKIRRTKKQVARPASCAELTAAGEQGLMVNRLVAGWALELLQSFLIRRELKWFALAFDLQWGGTRAYTLDLATLAETSRLKPSQLEIGRAKVAAVTRRRRRA